MVKRGRAVTQEPGPSRAQEREVRPLTPAYSVIDGGGSAHPVWEECVRFLISL